MKSFKQSSHLPAPQAPRRCQDLAFLECRTGAVAALWAIWAVSLLEKPFSEELFPRLSFCSVATGFHYQTYSSCHPYSTQGVQTGTSWPMDKATTGAKKSSSITPFVQAIQAMLFISQRLGNWALHALRAQTSLWRGWAWSTFQVTSENGVCQAICAMMSLVNYEWGYVLFWATQPPWELWVQNRNRALKDLEPTPGAGS